MDVIPMLTIITSIVKEGCVRTYLGLLLYDLLPMQKLFILLSLARQTVMEIPKTPLYPSHQYVFRTASKGLSELNIFSVKLPRTN